MRKPRLEDFDTTVARRKPEMVNMDGVVPIQAKLIPKTPPHQSQNDEMTKSPGKEEPTLPAHESNIAILQTRNISSNTAIFQQELFERVLHYLDQKNSYPATYRLPEEVLDKLRETEFFLQKNHKLKASKTSIVVAAVALLLLDFEENNENSILYKLTART